MDYIMYIIQWGNLIFRSPGWRGQIDIKQHSSISTLFSFLTDLDFRTWHDRIQDMIFNDGVTSGSVISVSCPFSASLRSWWCGGGGPVGARVVAWADSGLCTISDLSALVLVQP